MIQYFTAEEKWYISIIRGFTMSGDCKKEQKPIQAIISWYGGGQSHWNVRDSN